MGPWFKLGRVRGLVVRVHWSAPLGALLFGGGTWRGALAWVVVVLAHEAGHALLARGFGHGAHAIQIHAAGGECVWTPGRHPLAREIVAWGGVLGQLALFAVVSILAAATPFVSLVGTDAVVVLTGYNLLMAAYNLLPIGNLDGRRAWRLFVVAPAYLRSRIARAEGQRAGAEAAAFRRKLESMRGQGPYADRDRWS